MMIYYIVLPIHSHLTGKAERMLVQIGPPIGCGGESICERSGSPAPIELPEGHLLGPDGATSARSTCHQLAEDLAMGNYSPLSQWGGGKVKIPGREGRDGRGYSRSGEPQGGLAGRGRRRRPPNAKHMPSLEGRAIPSLPPRDVTGEGKAGIARCTCARRENKGR